MASFGTFAQAGRGLQIDMAKEALDRTLRRKAKQLEVTDRRTLYLWSEGVLGRLYQKSLSGRPGLNVMSGDLRRSFRHKEGGGPGLDLWTRMFTTSKYARLQEYGSAMLPGGVIRPTRSQKLAIPIKGSPATRSTGEPLYHSPLRANLPQGLNFWVMKAKSGKLYLADKFGRPWFRLMDMVRVPARLGFRRIARQEVQKLAKQLSKNHRVVVERGGYA
jgi:hypothetical protein